MYRVHWFRPHFQIVGLWGEAGEDAERVALEEREVGSGNGDVSGG